MPVREADVISVLSDKTDSYLSMKTVKTNQTIVGQDGITYNVYNTAAPFTTCGKMSYLYGYLEMRASVPYGVGAYPALWLKSQNAQYKTDGKFCGDPKLGWLSSSLYHTEIDIFEVFGKNYVKPNLHKWWNEGTKTYNDRINSGYISGEQINNAVNINTKDISFGEPYSVNKKQWHTYGFEWTPDSMSMYIDGKIYQTFNLNKNFGSNEDNYGMQGFKELPVSIVLGLQAYTPYSVKSQDWGNGATPFDDTLYGVGDTVFEYDIDYIRLYQKNDGKLWTKN